MVLPSPATPLPTLQSAKSATYSRQHAALTRQQCNGATHSSATCNAPDYRCAAGMRLQRDYNVGSASRSAPQQRGESAKKLANAATSILAVFRHVARAVARVRAWVCSATRSVPAAGACAAVPSVCTTCRERARCLRESAVSAAAPLPLRAPVRADCDNVPCSRRGSGLGEATHSQQRSSQEHGRSGTDRGLGPCAAEASVACEPRPTSVRAVPAEPSRTHGRARAGADARTDVRHADPERRVRAEPSISTRAEHLPDRLLLWTGRLIAPDTRNHRTERTIVS